MIEIMSNLDKFTQLRHDNEQIPEQQSTQEQTSEQKGETFKSRFSKYISRWEEMPQNITTFYNQIDNKLKIFGLCFLGGEPGTGKTAFLLNVLAQRALNNKKTIFLSFEMSVPEILQRLFSILLNRQIERQNKANIFDEQSKLIPANEIKPKDSNFENIKNKYIENFENITFIEPQDTINESGIFDTELLIKCVNRYKQTINNNDDILIMIDSLNMITSDNSNDERHAINDNIRKISKFLKTNNLTCICVAQSNRETMKTNNNNNNNLENWRIQETNYYDFTPLTYSFRESSLIEYTADCITYMLRENMDENSNICLVNVKNRKSKKNQFVRFSFIRNVFLFDELPEQVPEPEPQKQKVQKQTITRKNNDKQKGI